MPCLTSLDQFKDYLGLTSTSEDAQLRSFLDGVESAIERWCKRTFRSASYTEYYDGNGDRILTLDQRPLTAVSGVWVDQEGYYGTTANAFQGSNDQWTSGVDFAAKRTDQSEKNGSILVALRGLGYSPGFWPCGEGNIKVTYTAGYTAIPDDLILAIHLLASAIRTNAENGVAGAIKSETQGRYAYELMSGQDADSSGQEIVQARSILKQYREIVP